VISLYSERRERFEIIELTYDRTGAPQPPAPFNAISIPATPGTRERVALSIGGVAVLYEKTGADMGDRVNVLTKEGSSLPPLIRLGGNQYIRVPIAELPR
jgi:hypothetical protein